MRLSSGLAEGTDLQARVRIARQSELLLYVFCRAYCASLPSYLIRF